VVIGQYAPWGGSFVALHVGLHGTRRKCLDTRRIAAIITEPTLGATLPSPPPGSTMNDIIDFFLANPLYLAPILLLVAMLAYALLKKLIKMGVIVAIATALYVLFVEYFGGGSLPAQIPGVGS